MSRIANALNMYILLQGRNLMTAQELADILEVSPRMIKSYKKDLEEVGINIKSKRPVHMKQQEREIWNLINRGIINKKKIKMSYKPIKEDPEKRKSKIRVVHPHGSFEYHGSTYFIGYCELRKKIRTFKLSRIEDIEITEEKFAINIEYDIKGMLRRSFGIIDDDVFELKLKISYPMSQLVKERQYALNQKITEIDEETIIFEARLKGYQEVKAWVLGMGSKVEVLGPEELKNDVVEEVGKLRELYE